MREGADPAVLADQQNVGIAGTRPHHGVFRKCRTIEDRGELRRRRGVLGMGDANALPVYEIAAQVRRAERDSVPGPRTLAPAVVRVPPAQREGGRKQRRRRDVQQTVNQAGSS
jgi:hypothetical protein